MKTSNKKLVVWAIDPFEVEHFSAQEDAVRTLDRLIDSSTIIQPVFVWGGRPLGSVVKPSQIAQQADLILGKWPKPKLEVQTRNLKVIVAGGTNSARAKALAEYAKRVRCDLILTSHHTRSTLKRAFIGSFSESLSLAAESPLLIVPPSAQNLSRAHGILFPTDFSSASMGAFEDVLHLATMSNSKLTIFHKIESFTYYPVEFAHAYSSEVLGDLVKDAKQSLAEMKTRATRAGVKAETILDANPGHVGHAIASRAEQGFGLVAMAAHKGFWDRAIMGSTSRFVLRECPTAVWVFRPTLKSAEKKERGAKKEALKTPMMSGSYLV